MTAIHLNNRYASTHSFFCTASEGGGTMPSKGMSEGIQERNAKRLPHNGFATDELRCIVSFLQENAILLPGKIPGYKRTDLQLLPTNTTKRDLWEHYVRSCATLTFRMSGYTRFCCLWRRYVPHILITTP